MSETNKTRKNTRKNAEATQDGKLVDVLYQKMGDRWFAFSLIDNEVFFGSITNEEIHASEAQSSTSSEIGMNSASHRGRGNA